MKRGEISIKVLIFILITLVAIIPIFVTYGKLIFFVDKIPLDVLQCRQSALLSLQIGGEVQKFKQGSDVIGAELSDLPYICPASQLNVSSKKLDSRLSSSEKREYKELEYTSEREYKLDSLIWGEVNSCYNKMFYGEHPLFERNWVDFDEANFCVVCSVIDFDKTVANEFSGNQDFSLMLLNKTVGVDEETLFQKMRGHSENHLGMMQSTYTTNTKNAIVYVRTNKPIASDTIAAISSLDVGWSIGSYALGGLIGFGIYAYTNEVDQKESNKYKDRESLIFVDYTDPNVLKDNCDVLVAEMELAQQ